MTVLAVFFTRGVSLKQWVDTGLFDREVLIYKHHLGSGQINEAVWFTYGIGDALAERELRQDGRLPPRVLIVSMPSWLSVFGRGASLVYSFLMPLVMFRKLSRCDVFKTNQMDGALAAVIGARLLRKPLYVRTGYTLSLFVDRLYPNNRLRRGFAWLTEKIAFRRCDAASVSSKFDRDYLIRRYDLTKSPPVVIGNYIDVDRFSPRPQIIAKDRMICVGRLSPQKNLEAGIEACALEGVGLDIVGDGPDRAKLQRLAEKLGADVGWLGVLPNDHLPELLSTYRFFFLPSLWEGMPKALLEAMAAGMVCIGNDAIGINEVITDGVTGYLSSGSDPRSLAEAVRRALRSDHSTVSMAARAFACDHFSLDAVAAKESRILSELQISPVNLAS